VKIRATLFSLMLLCISYYSTAQEVIQNKLSWKTQAYFTANGVKALGNADDVYSIGYGFNGGVYLRQNENLSFSVNTGYYFIPTKKESELQTFFFDFSTWQEQIIPLTGGVHWRTDGASFQPYVGLDAGLLFRYISQNSSFLGLTSYIYDRQIYFVVTPKVGFNVPISSQWGIDMNVQYTRVFVDYMHWNGLLNANLGLSYNLD